MDFTFDNLDPIGRPFPGGVKILADDGGLTYKYVLLDDVIAEAVAQAGGGGTPSLPALTAPVITMAALSSSSLRVTITNGGSISGEASFRVEVSSNGTSGWTLAGTIAANGTTFDITGLPASTLRYARVKAIANPAMNTDSAYSNIANATTSAASLPALTAPVITATALSSSSIQIDITNGGSITGETGFLLQISDNGSTWFDYDNLAANATMYVVGSLPAATLKYFRVKAVANPATNTDSAYSNTASATTSAGSSQWTKKAATTMTSSVGGYWEWKPSTYSPSGAPVPVIIAWHGGGAVGTGSSSDLNLLLNEGVAQQINADGFVPQMLVICPQYQGLDASGAPSAAQIEGVIDYVLANYNVDPTRVHLTGLSFGGAILGKWAVTGTLSKVASISVLCNYFDVDATAVSRLKAAGMPIRLYHGDADSVAPVTNSRNWFNSLNAATSIVPAAQKYEIAGADHNIWVDVYAQGTSFGGFYWADWHNTHQRSSLSDVTFTSVTNLSQSGTVWTATAGGATGLASVSLAPGVSGRFIAKWNDSNNNFAVISLDPDNAEEVFGSMKYGLYLQPTTNLPRIIDAGAAGGEGNGGNPIASISAGFLYSLRRDGADGTVYAEYSTNGGTSWVLYHTFSVQDNGRLYLKVNAVNSGNIITDPKQSGAA